MNIFDELIKVKNLRKKLAIFLFIFIFIFSYFNFLLLPLKKERATLLKKQLDNLIQEAINKREIIRRKKKLELYKKEEKEFNRLKKMVYSYDDEFVMLQIVDNLLQKNGVELISFESKKNVKTEDYEALPYFLHIHGRYFDVKSFIFKLSSLDKIVDIKKISFFKSQKIPFIECAVFFVVYRM